MKRTSILLLAIMALSSCAVFYPSERITLASFVDYRPYTSAGFFISPDPYPGRFEAMGELIIEVIPAELEISYDERHKYDHIRYWDMTVSGAERIPHAELLEMAVVRTIALGGNGISNLKITKETDMSDNVVYRVTGLCIKIDK